MARNQLHNDGHRPLAVPGFNNFPIYLELPAEERFTHGANEWEPPPLTARELAMLKVMNEATEKPDWHHQVFDDEIVINWREEALKTRLMSNRAWDWCLAELRDKAEKFKATGRVLVLNTGSGVCKSDILVPSELKAEIKSGVAPLLAISDAENGGCRNAKSTNPGVDTRRRGVPRGRERARGRGQPGGGKYVRRVPSFRNHVVNLVDPSLFPLVYGRTRVMADGGEVDLDVFLNCSGRGSVAPEYEEHPFDEDAVEEKESR
jgi:hypothetical protein